MSTINHTLSWYQQDKDKRKVSLKKVRRLHAAANRKTISVNGKDAFMTQFDMVTTQFAFIGSAMILPEEIGLGTPAGKGTLIMLKLPITFGLNNIVCLLAHDLGDVPSLALFLTVYPAHHTLVVERL